jgi:hypothetical protein
VQANAHQGLKRSNSDKQHSVRQLLETDLGKSMSAVDIATAAGVADTFVSQSTETTGIESLNRTVRFRFGEEGPHQPRHAPAHLSHQKGCDAGRLQGPPSINQSGPHQIPLYFPRVAGPRSRSLMLIFHFHMGPTDWDDLTG